MLPVALLSRVTLTTITLINRYCIDIYTHFSRLLRAPAVRFAWGGKRPPEYNYPPKNQLTDSTPKPGGARPWHCPAGDRACPGYASANGGQAARRGYALPDPRHDNTHYASPETLIP
jgi:hypothetical protein